MLLTFLLVIVVVAPPIPATAALAGVLDPGRVWLVILVAIVWAFDTGAYVTGRLLPRGRFMAFISPSKTWSGVIGGAVAATVVGAVLTAATGHAATDGALVGLVVGVAGQLGDLAESALKRAAGAKDSGTLIPGHGGILDRVDSFLFAAPVLCIYLVSLDHLT